MFGGFGCWGTGTLLCRDGERAQILLDSITAPPHGVVWQERGHMGSRVQGLRFVRAAAVLLIERQRPEASAALVDVLRAVVLPLANSRNTMKGVSNVLLTAAVNNLGDLASCSAKSVALLCGAAHEKGWPSSGRCAFHSPPLFSFLLAACFLVALSNFFCLAPPCALVMFHPDTQHSTLATSVLPSP